MEPSSRSRPTVVLVSAEATLAGIDTIMRRHGARLVRLVALRPNPIPPARWMARVHRAAPPDTIVLTSRAAVSAGLRPWRRAVRHVPPGVEIWAVGPGTADAIRKSGFGPVRSPGEARSDALATALRRTPSRKVLYFRSNAAGPALSRGLRRQGHRVTDPIVYRLSEPPRFRASEQTALARADVLVVTSPSGFAVLRRRARPSVYARLAREVPTVVLGARSEGRARAYGFRKLSVAPSTVPQRFTRHLLRQLEHARS
jgi:uroporphyrinogen-III synthase